MGNDVLKKRLVDLDARARAGDLKALQELQKIRAMVQTVVQGARAQRAVDSILGALETSQGEQESDKESIGAVRQADILSLAEEIDLQRPRADDLEHKSMLREAQKGQLAAQAPYVRINPSSAVGQQVGNTVVVTDSLDPNGLMTLTGAASSKVAQVAQWVGETEETLPITVCFQPYGPVIPVNKTKQGLRAYGIVQFGTRGFPAKMEVDIGNGMQFTLPGSSAILQVGLEVNPDGGSGDDFQYTGMIGYWPGNKTEKVTRTCYVTGNAGDPAAQFNVPPYARSFQLMRTATSDPVNIGIWDSSHTIIGIVIVPALEQQLEPIPLSGDAATVSVADGGVDGLGQTRLIFNLGF